MGVSHRGSFASSLEGRELLRWAAKADGPCAVNEEHTCVYAKITARTSKSCLASAHSHILGLMRTQRPAKHTHTYKNKTTLARALITLTCSNMIPLNISQSSTACALWLLFTPHLFLTLSCEDSSNF